MHIFLYYIQTRSVFNQKLTIELIFCGNQQRQYSMPNFHCN